MVSYQCDLMRARACLVPTRFISLHVHANVNCEFSSSLLLCHSTSYSSNQSAFYSFIQLHQFATDKNYILLDTFALAVSNNGVNTWDERILRLVKIWRPTTDDRRPNPTNYESKSKSFFFAPDATMSPLSANFQSMSVTRVCALYWMDS